MVILWVYNLAWANFEVAVGVTKRMIRMSRMFKRKSKQGDNEKREACSGECVYFTLCTLPVEPGHKVCVMKRYYTRGQSMPE